MLVLQAVVGADLGAQVLGANFTLVKYGHRAFSNIAPFLWNSLPSAVRKANSTFQRRLLNQT